MSLVHSQLLVTCGDCVHIYNFNISEGRNCINILNFAILQTLQILFWIRYDLIRILLSNKGMQKIL